MRRSLIDEIKKGTPRQTIIAFPDGEHEDIVRGIHSGSMSLEKSLCDDSETVVIEGCIASIFKATIEGIEDLSGAKIKVIQRICGYELSLFTGTIDECPLQSDRKSRTITTYDDFYTYSDRNVADWYNSLVYPIDIANFLKSLLDYVGIPYVANLDIRQSFEVKKTLDTSSIAFSTVIKTICQVIGGFGVINPDGEFDIVYLSNEVYGQALNAMSGFELESYNVKAIDKVVVRSEETDIGGTCGEGSNAYIIQGNFLCFGMDADSIASVAAELYKNVAGFTWRPCLFELGVGNPLIGCDGMRYRIVTSQGDDFETYIFNSYISGVQLFSQELESFGSETRKEVVADDYTDALVTAYKVMKVKATVDGFDLQIEDKVGEDEVITKINASAEKVAISSEKIDIAGLVKFINEDESDATEIDGGTLKNKSISTEKLSVENLDAICANIGGFTIEDGKIVFLESSSYQDINSGEDKMSYWYSFGINPEGYAEDTKVMWFGAHPITVGSGIDENGYYTEDSLVYPFYITADGKFISNGDEYVQIWGSGKIYQVSQIPGTSDLIWNGAGEVEYGKEFLQIASGYILFNDITRISSSGIVCNDTNVLDFTNVGIYSPEINSEIIKAKESVTTTKVWCEEIDTGTVTALDSRHYFGNAALSDEVRLIVRNSKCSTALLTAASGNHGLYDITNEKWMMYNEINGTCSIIPNSLKVTGSRNEFVEDYFCFQTSDGSGKTGFWKICTITIKNTYADERIIFTVNQRGGRSGKISLQFSSSSTVTGHSVVRFTQVGNLTSCVVIKNGDATFDVYMTKSGAYDHMTITKIDYPYYMRVRLTITWHGTYVSSLPTTGTATALTYLGDHVLTSSASGSSISFSIAQGRAYLINMYSNNGMSASYLVVGTTGAAQAYMIGVSGSVSASSSDSTFTVTFSGATSVNARYILI